MKRTTEQAQAKILKKSLKNIPYFKEMNQIDLKKLPCKRKYNINLTDYNSNNSIF